MKGEKKEKRFHVTGDSTLPARQCSYWNNNEILKVRREDQYHRQVCALNAKLQPAVD